MAKYKSVQQNIDLRFNVFFEKRLGGEDMRRLGELLGAQLILLTQKRIGRGLDNRNRRFKKYTRKYRTFKSKFIRGKAGSSRTVRRLRKQADEPFQAHRVYDYMRLTGNLFEDMQYELIDYSRKGLLSTRQMGFKIKLYIARRSLPKARGLFENGYKFFGFPRMTNREYTKLYKIINNYVKYGQA